MPGMSVTTANNLDIIRQFPVEEQELAEKIYFEVEMLSLFPLVILLCCVTGVIFPLLLLTAIIDGDSVWNILVYIVAVLGGFYISKKISIGLCKKYAARVHDKISAMVLKSPESKIVLQRLYDRVKLVTHVMDNIGFKGLNPPARQ